MKVNIKLFALLLLLSLLSCNQQNKETKKFVLLKVSIGTVVSQVKVSGRAEAALQQIIQAPFDTPVKKLNSSIGDQVEKEGILAELDAEALNKKVSDDQLALEQIKARRKTSIIKLNTIKVDKSRNIKLFKSGAVSKSELEKSKSDLKVAISDLEVLESEIEIKDKRLMEVKKQRNNLVLKSPFDGIVTYVWKNKEEFTPGMSVNKGDLLFKISSRGKMQIKTTVRESDVSKIAKGMPVEVTFPGLRKATNGRISYLDSAATIDKNSGVSSYRVVIDFQPIAKLRPGMQAKVIASIAKKENVVTVSKPSIKLGEGNSAFVQRVIEGKKEKVAVKIGLIGDNNVEVVSGLSAGDDIIAAYE
ncbi:MAG: efflux RND transporter periplasmic adaptor subunit [Bacteriovoracaceae bacterium]|jgi:RND family efflux transporter MFP subunit|nr:efflux RND transporter periplasmic adaptor subunit [Bacteriovoracaceae bacterium]